MPETAATIKRYAELTPSRSVHDGVDAVFFESSNTKIFASDAARAAFRERWLGRYLEHDPQFAYVAMTGDGRVAGYLAGCVSDPAITPRFDDLAYFQIFKDWTRQFPAHLHVNLALEFRGCGLGAALVEAFIADARAAGAPGVHVVTGRSAGNAGFYERCGFSVRTATGEGASKILFLGRRLP